MSAAALYDGVTCKAVTPGVVGHLTTRGCCVLDMLSIDNPAFDDWNGEPDLYLVLSATHPEEIHHSDLTTLVLELTGGGYVGIFGPTDAAVAEAKQRLQAEVVHERRLTRRTPV